MNVLHSPQSEFKPSGEHAPFTRDAREAVASALASIANSDPSMRLEQERIDQPSVEVMYLQNITQAQRDLRILAMRLGSRKPS